MASAVIETPSGKGARDENFQVASVLLPARLRAHVLAFYHFVRAADDIADNPDLAPDDKLRRLELFDLALVGDPSRAPGLDKAAALRASLTGIGVTAEHARDLLRAFRQDAVKRRYGDLADLLGYCRLSASPVGRFLLDLHGEDAALWRLSDPLCDALQILNHLQDCKADYLRLDRVYLPLDAFRSAGIGVEALALPRAGTSMRTVLDTVLDATDDLLVRARDLPAALRSPRLAAESAVVLEMARVLARMLRRRDPLAERVELGRPRFMWVTLSGLGRVTVQRLRPRTITSVARMMPR